MVDVNVIHLSTPSGGKGRKHTALNLEKQLEEKKTVIRIQNKDDFCMANALEVAKAKVDNDPQYKSIIDHRRPMQTGLVQKLHTNTGIPLGLCGIDEANQFQAYLSDNEINIMSKEYNYKVIYAGPGKDKKQVLKRS